MRSNHYLYALEMKEEFPEILQFIPIDEIVLKWGKYSDDYAAGWMSWNKETLDEVFKKDQPSDVASTQQDDEVVANRDAMATKINDSCLSDKDSNYNWENWKQEFFDISLETEWNKESYIKTLKYKRKEINTLDLFNLVKSWIQSARNDAAAMGFNRVELKRMKDIMTIDCYSDDPILAKLDKILKEGMK